MRHKVRGGRSCRSITRSISWPCSRWASTPICSTANCCSASHCNGGRFAALCWLHHQGAQCAVAYMVARCPRRSPTPISMILAGVLLKMGGYGILRICYPICPHAGYDLAYFVCALGVVSMVYGAFAALAQKDFKRMVAYSSVSHMGYVVLGLGVWSAVAGTAI